MRSLSVLAAFITLALVPVTLFCQESAKSSQSPPGANIEQVLKLNEQLMAAEVRPDAPSSNSRAGPPANGGELVVSRAIEAYEACIY